MNPHRMILTMIRRMTFISRRFLVELKVVDQ
jgi:hypothetical protein